MAPSIAMLAVLLFISILDTGFAKPKMMECYECNVWKAGYGTKCNEWHVRDECYFCMKLITTTYVGYYKSRPKESVVESRVCGRSRTVPYKNTCVRVNTMDGHTIHCYCDRRDLCNSAVVRQAAKPVMLVALAIGILSRWMNTLL